MKLCALSGVSSWEDEVRDFLKTEAAPYADEIRTDALGNLIVFKRGAKPAGNKLMLCAHMDEVGLMVRKITDEGCLKFDTVGGIDRRVLLGKRVLVGPQKVPGVVGLKAYHLVSREEEKSVPKLDEFYIDIGAKDRAGAEKLVSLGDAAAFDSGVGEFGGGLFQAKALGEQYGLVGRITQVCPEPVTDCLERGYIPVVSTVAQGTDAEVSYNVNADTAAAKLAVAMGAEKLILLTDVRGLLRDPKDESTLISELQLSSVPALVREGVISGGMIPKVNCCVEAVRSGVKSAVILDGRVAHSLLIELLSDAGVGTMLIQ